MLNKLGKRILCGKNITEVFGRTLPKINEENTLLAKVELKN